VGKGVKYECHSLNVGDFVGLPMATMQLIRVYSLL